VQESQYENSNTHTFIRRDHLLQRPRHEPAGKQVSAAAAGDLLSKAAVVEYNIKESCYEFAPKERTYRVKVRSIEQWENVQFPGANRTSETTIKKSIKAK
jgi:hypothetical protein